MRGKQDAGEPVPHTVLDHPRACGENIAGWEADMQAAGSPPRMRGKHNTAAPHVYRVRITPAHAGKTLHCVPDVLRDADHPRACGEN